VAAFAVDAVAFRTGVYRRLLEPSSYAGQVEIMLDRAARSRAGVLVLGDSRIAEGFSARLADSSGPLRYFNAAIPGSSPRCWYYLLQRLDPARWQTIVVPLDNYEDEDGDWDFADNPLDTAILAGTLTLAAAPEFVLSHSSLPARAAALRAALFKGFAFQRDFQQFLAAPRARLHAVAQFRAHGAEWSDGYQGRPESVNPGPIAARVPSPQRGVHHRYRMRWLSKIQELAGPRVVAIRLPRGPQVVPSPPGLPSAVRTLGIVRAPEALFAGLERPEFFADTLHLNREGRTRFSLLLAAWLAQQAAGRGR